MIVVTVVLLTTEIEGSTFVTVVVIVDCPEEVEGTGLVSSPEVIVVIVTVLFVTAVEGIQ